MTTDLLTVRQVARVSGVSVRTLHHYDQIGLLKPARVGANGYRLYGRAELLRLQQILLHRELEFPLDAIRQILATPGFDRLTALRRQRQALAARAARYRQLLDTLDASLADLEGETTMTDETLFQGFSPETQARHESWLRDRYGQRTQGWIESSKQKQAALNPGRQAGLQAEIEAVEAAMASAMTDGLPLDSEAVQGLVQRHHAWVAQSWPAAPTAEAYAGLALMYLEHPDFTARYEARAAGLTEYLTSAMRCFAETRL